MFKLLFSNSNDLPGIRHVQKEVRRRQKCLMLQKRTNPSSPCTPFQGTAFIPTISCHTDLLQNGFIIFNFNIASKFPHSLKSQLIHQSTMNKIRNVNELTYKFLSACLQRRKEDHNIASTQSRQYTLLQKRSTSHESQSTAIKSLPNSTVTCPPTPSFINDSSSNHSGLP